MFVHTVYRVTFILGPSEVAVYFPKNTMNLGPWPFLESSRRTRNARFNKCKIFSSPFVSTLTSHVDPPSWPEVNNLNADMKRDCAIIKTRNIPPYWLLHSIGGYLAMKLQLEFKSCLINVIKISDQNFIKSCYFTNKLIFYFLYNLNTR